MNIDFEKKEIEIYFSIILEKYGYKIILEDNVLGNPMILLKNSRVTIKFIEEDHTIECYLIDNDNQNDEYSVKSILYYSNKDITHSFGQFGGNVDEFAFILVIYFRETLFCRNFDWTSTYNKKCEFDKRIMSKLYQIPMGNNIKQKFYNGDRSYKLDIVMEFENEFNISEFKELYGNEFLN